MYDMNIFRELIQKTDDLQREMAEFDIVNPKVLELRDRMIENLKSNKTSQVLVLKNMKRIQDDLVEELEDETSADLKMANLIRDFVRMTEEYNIHRLAEYNLLKEFIIKILDLYEDYELAIRNRNITVKEVLHQRKIKLEKKEQIKKTLDPEPKDMATQITAIINKYNKIKKLKYQDMATNLTSAEFHAEKFAKLNHFKRELVALAEKTGKKVLISKIFRQETAQEGKEGDELFR